MYNILYLQLHERDIRRVTFLVVQREGFPKYFTFRASLGYAEDTIYRHLEPALAFQLELYRLENYRIQFIPTNNFSLHLYYSESKDNTGVAANDRRFFMRAIIRHADLLSKQASLEYFLKEGERQVVEALNELEVCFHDGLQPTLLNTTVPNFSFVALVGVYRRSQVCENRLQPFVP